MQKEIITKIEPIIRNILSSNKIELIDIIYRKESVGNVLRIIADTVSGITLDECTKINELVGEALDKDDLIEESYTLEVSSPGLDRPLKTKNDFLRQKGKKIRVHTYAPIADKKDFIGTLKEIDEKRITLLADKMGEIDIELDKISSAKLDF